MSNDARCGNCSHSLFDCVWGEYKCKEKQRVCTDSEIAMGCSEYEPFGTQPGKPKPEIVVRSGATFTPSISADGVLSWTNDKGLINPEPVKVIGPNGYTPIKGVDYFDGKDGINGKDGQPGRDGKDGTDGKDGQPGKDGRDGVDGKTPVKGTDYFTEADKAEIVSAVIEQLPIYNGEAVSE